MIRFLVLLCLLPVFVLLVVMPIWKYRAWLKEKRGQRERSERFAKLRVGFKKPLPIWTGGDNFSVDDNPIAIEYPEKSLYKPSDLKNYGLDDDLLERMEGETYTIFYRDSSGELTQRDITIENIHYTKRQAYIEAYCHLREDERDFKISRIQGFLVNTRTGEKIDPEELDLKH